MSFGDARPELLRAALALFALRVQPAICEFLDRYSVDCAERATGKVVFKGRRADPDSFCARLAGGVGGGARAAGAALKWARGHGLAHRAARTRAEADKLWEVRRACSSAMFEMGDSKLNEDVVVPMAKYGQFARYLERLRRESALPIPTFGHLGDGNLHVNIMYHRDDPRERRAAERAVVSSPADRGAELGGAISNGEHGIGLAKTPFLRFQHSPAAIRAMMAVKKALDPRGILNPGRVCSRSIPGVGKQTGRRAASLGSLIIARFPFARASAALSTYEA